MGKRGPPPAEDDPSTERPPPRLPPVDPSTGAASAPESPASRFQPSQAYLARASTTSTPVPTPSPPASPPPSTSALELPPPRELSPDYESLYGKDTDDLTPAPLGDPEHPSAVPPDVHALPFSRGKYNRRRARRPLVLLLSGLSLTC